MFSIYNATSSVRRRILLSSILMFVAVALITGCSKGPSTPATSPVGGTSAVIATVNGVGITRDQMYFEMEQYIPSQLPGYPNNPLLGLPAGQVQLQQLLQNELLAQYAKSIGAPVTDSDIDLRYKDIKTFRDLLMTRSFEDMLKDQDITIDEYKFDNVRPLVAKFNIATKGLTATDAELHAYYNSHLIDYTDPESVHFERIVLNDEGAAEQAYQIAFDKGSLDSVLSMNRAPALTGGANDADIVEWLRTNMPASQTTALIKQAAATKPGTVLKPMEIGNQWWLVKVVDVRPKLTLPYDQVQHIVYWNVLEDKAKQAGNIEKTQAGLLSFIQSAAINVPKQYASLVPQLKNPTAAAAIPPPTESPNN